MAGTAERTLALKLIADVNGLNGPMTKAQSRMGKFAKSAASWGKALGGALVIKGFEVLADSIGENIAAIKEQEKLLVQTKTVLKSTGRASGQTAKGIVKLSEAIEDMSGIDQEAVQNAENLLLTFTNIKGPIFQQATRAVVDMSVALGTDLKGASIQVGKALNDPIKGVTALQRVGVSFTQTQRDTIKRLVETGHAAEAQKLILRELAKEFGGSAAAAGKTFEGQLRRIGQAWGDVIQGFIRGDFKGVGKSLGKLGDVVEDVLFGGKGKNGIRDSATKGLVNQVKGWGQKLGEAVKSNFPESIPFFDTLGQVGELGGKVTEFIGNLVPALGSLAEAVQPAYDAVKPFVDLALLPFTTTLAAAIGLLSVVNDILKGDFDTAVSDAQATLQGLADTVSAAFDAVLDAVRGVAQTVVDVWNSLGRIDAGSFQLWGPSHWGIPGTDFGLDIPGLGFSWGAQDLIPNIPNVAASRGTPSAVGKKAPDLPGRAMGGPVSAGSPYIVGERGPELLIPRSNGTILPNGSGGSNYSINVYVAPGGDLVEAGRQMVRAIQQYEKRGGSGWRAA